MEWASRRAKAPFPTALWRSIFTDMALLRRVALLLPAAALAGLYVPTPALLVNRAKPQEVDLRENGLVAHIRDSGFDVGVHVDLVRLADQEKFRISLDPRPPPPGGPNRPYHGTDVVFQQLPPGTYLATKISLGTDDPVAFKPDTLVVRAGQILSLGRIRVAPDLDMLGLMEKLEVQTTVWDIDSAIKAVRAYGIDTLPVVSKHLRWTVEPK